MLIISTFWFLLILTFQTVFASPALIATIPEPLVHFDYGGFSLQGCSVYHSNVMHNVLKASGVALGLAIEDLAQHQLNSSDGFKALFKAEENLHSVYSLLSNIETGHSLAHHTSPTQSKVAPCFVCVTPEVTSIAGISNLNPYEYCQHGDRIAAYANPSRYILLCEEFFRLPLIPKPSSHGCPSVAENKFVDSRSIRVARYQSYIAIHEMVHYYYLGSSLGHNTNPPEVYDLNKCVALSATNSLRNPANYQFYVAFVQQGCTQAPNPFLPPFSQPS